MLPLPSTVYRHRRRPWNLPIMSLKNIQNQMRPSEWKKDLPIFAGKTTQKACSLKRNIIQCRGTNAEKPTKRGGDLSPAFLLTKK